MDRSSYYRSSKSLIRKLYTLNQHQHDLRLSWPKGSTNQWKREYSRLSLLIKAEKNKRKQLNNSKKGGAPKRPKKPRKPKKPELPQRIIRGREAEEAKLGRVIRQEERDIALKRQKKPFKKVSREQLGLPQQRERDIDRLAPRTLQYRLTGSTTRNHVPDFQDTQLIRDLIKNSNVRNNVRVLYYLDGSLQRERTYAQTSGRQFKDATFYDWLEGPSPQRTISDIQWNTGDQLIIIQPASNIPARQIVQRYLATNIDKDAQASGSGSEVVHCAFSAPIQWAKLMIKKVKSKWSINNYKKIIKTSKDYIKKYPTGATIDEITEFCNKIKVTYHINDVFNKLFHKITVKNSRKTMTFTNSRIDHLDLWGCNSETKELTQKEMNIKYEELRKDHPQYAQDKFGNKRWIATPTQKYKAISEHRQVYEKFYEDYVSIKMIRQIDKEILEKKDEIVAWSEAKTNLYKKSHSIKNSNIYADEKIHELIRAGLHQTESINYPNYSKSTPKNSIRLDQHRAYASFKLCSYYQKFPFLFNEFAYVDVPNKNYQEFLKNHLGIYFITDVSYDNIKNENLKKHMQYIQPYTKGYSGDITLPSPELMYMLDIGITFNIVCGAWTHFPFDFEFSNEMHEHSKCFSDKSEKTGPRYYQMIVGEWSAFRPTDVICMDGTEDWAIDLKNKGYDVQYFSNSFSDKSETTKGEGTIQCTFTKDLDRISHKSHLSAFICSYQRIQLFQQLKDIPFEHTFAIITDEIVIRKSSLTTLSGKSTLSNIRIHKGFREKNSDKQIPFSCARQLLSLTQSSITFPTQEEPRSDLSDSRYVWGKSEEGGYRAYIGPGGTGKTHSFMINNTLLRKIYTAPSHQLRQDKQDEYSIFDKDRKSWNIQTEVHHNMINYPGLQKYINPRMPSTIFHDELTCSSQEEIDQLKLLYPYSTIILGGDMSKDGLIYQLPCIKGTPVSISDCNITLHTENRRAKDNQLKELLSWYREQMSINNPDLLQQTIDKLQSASKQQLKNQYTNDDYVLTGKHTAIKEWTKLLKTKVAKDGSIIFLWKYLITKNHTKIDDVNSDGIKISLETFNGTIIKNKKLKITKSIVERHAFTCHQIQGSTIKNKIYIDINNLFDKVRMLYVALSRAEYIDQLIIIK